MSHFLRRGAVLVAGLALLALGAMPPSFQDQEFPPDLAITGAEPHFEEEGAVLVLDIEVTNVGAHATPETSVRVSGWEEVEVGVPPLGFEERVMVAVGMPIPLELAGSEQELLVVLDPFEVIEGDRDRENNQTVVFVQLPERFEGGPPEELFIEGVEPDQIEQGQSTFIDIFGGGFQPESEVIVSEVEASSGRGLLRPAVDVAAQGVTVGQVIFQSGGQLTVEIFVEPDAPPGARSITVRNPNGSTARLPFAFEVVVGGGEFEGGGGVPWPLIVGGLGALLLLGAGIGAVALTASALGGPSKKALQKQAQKQKPPQSCVKGQRWVTVSEVGVSPGRWEVEELAVQMFDAASGARGARHPASDALVKEINEAIKTRRRARGDQTVERPQLPGAEGLAAQVVGWQALESAARDAWLEARLEGGEVEVTFEEFKCKGTPPNTYWDSAREWQGSLPFTDRHVGTVKGPKSGEAHEVFVQRTRQEVEARLRELVDAVARM